MAIPVGPAVDSAWAAQLVTGRAASVDGASAPKRVSEPVLGEAEPTPGSLESAVEEINQSLGGQSVGVRFEVDADTDRVVIKVVDRESGDLIRQIPSEEVLRIAKLLGKVPGALMDQSA